VSFVFALAMCLLLVAAPLAAVRSRLGGGATLAGSLLLTATGVAAAAGWARPVLDLGSWLGFGTAHLRADGLAGIFLGLLGLTAAAVSAGMVERRQRRSVCALHALLVWCCAVAIAADQAFLFFLAWEGLTVVLYLLASADTSRPGHVLAGYLTGTITKVGGGALLAAFGLLYGQTGSFRFADWIGAAGSISHSASSVAFVLFMVAFATKVGIFPLQGALPVGYSAAPGLGAASISVALTAGYYGIWRFVIATLAPGLWWGELLLVIGGLTAFGGILYAITQDEVRRFLGFSTIENAGIAMLGVGVALIGHATGSAELEAAGLLAATLHVIAHGIGKTLAFLSTDRVERATGVRDFGPLGGLGRRLPRSASGFGVATLTLAAIPPLGGFVSEWLTFMALLQGFRVDHTFARLLLGLAAALLALTAGLAALGFAKAFGFLFLGRARQGIDRVRETADPGVGMAALGLVALSLGIIAPWEIHLVGAGLSSLLGFDLSSTAIKHPLTLGPVYRDFSVLAPTWLAIALPAYALTAALLVRLLVRPRVRRAPVWVTGSGADIAELQYRPAAYSNPMRVVLQGPYGFRRELERRDGERNEHDGTLVLNTRVVLAVEQYVYAPLARLFLAGSARVRRLQSGRLSAYLLYMLIVLIVVLALIPTLHSP
jgi:formate hydrogenlyase subunit 3/multisubunit Na+/H+ antiporter MnhD subunit